MTDPGPTRPVDALVPNRRPAILGNRCVFAPHGAAKGSFTEEMGPCKGDGSATTFNDDLSRREYVISGLCQACQDDLFTPGGEG